MTLLHVAYPYFSDKSPQECMHLNLLMKCFARFHDYWDQFIWDHVNLIWRSFETTVIWDHFIWDHFIWDHLIWDHFTLTSKTNLAPYCQKSPIGLQSLIFHTLSKDWVVVWGVFTKLRFGRAQKNLGTAALAILAWAVEALFCPWVFK